MWQSIIWIFWIWCPVFSTFSAFTQIKGWHINRAKKKEGENMKRMIRAIVLSMVLFLSIPQTALAAQLLIPGGQLVGLELQNDAVTVAAFDDVCGGTARDAGLQIGDQILSIDGQPVKAAEDVRRALKNCTGAAEITVLRGSKQMTLRLVPADTREGKRMGVYLRQGIAGVGTVTFYDPESDVFGTLGHGVNDGKGGLLPMTQGRACEASVASVRKGRPGNPGQLRGSADADDVLGKITKNTPQGVFGTSRTGFSGEPLPVAEFSDVTVGPATIRSTISGDDVREYSVEILKIYPSDRSDCRNFLLLVTDPELLKETGGIVQGMSGSPIIQNGKLIGAVTHVLVNDPTRGYGIFIENMLDAAG
jgi:stage IV sporulation protein B